MAKFEKLFNALSNKNLNILPLSSKKILENDASIENEFAFSPPSMCGTCNQSAKQ